MRTTLSLWILLLASAASGDENSTCSQQSNSAVHFSVVGYKNHTGNRKFNAEMRSNIPSESNPVTFNVDHWSEQCGDREIVAMNVVVTGPQGNNSDISKIKQGIHRRPRRLDYCLLLPASGAYKVHTNGKSWEAAKHTCEEESSHLMIIETKQELELLVDMLMNAGQEWSHITVWIGLFRQNASASWRTLLGGYSDNPSFINWSSSGPSDNGNCGAFRVHTYQRKIRYLANPKCHVPLFFVCEQDL